MRLEMARTEVWNLARREHVTLATRQDTRFGFRLPWVSSPVITLPDYLAGAADRVTEVLVMLLTSFRTVKAFNRYKLRTALTMLGMTIGVAAAQQANAPLSVFHAELSTPAPLRAGTPAELTFAVKDAFGRNTGAMQIVHQRPMHVMIVSADLADFYHIHPTLSAGNVFRVTQAFPHGGDYRLFADFTPVGGGNHIESFSVNAQGAGRAAIPLDPAAGWTGTAGSVRMTLASDKPLRAGEDIGLSMTLVDAGTGAPVHDLQRYLGAWAHIAIISQDTQDFLHIHPVDELPSTFEFFWYVVKRDYFHSAAPPMPGAASPATIRTFAGFRRAGLYKMWVEVLRANQVLTVPFVLRVAPGARQVTQIPQAPSGATLIKVSSAGYEPSRIPAKAGRPLKLAFFRVDAQNCGRVVKFPDLGIERELPPGQTIVIAVTPRKSGPLAFSCGMNMMKGELVVQ